MSTPRAVAESQPDLRTKAREGSMLNKTGAVIREMGPREMNEFPQKMVFGKKKNLRGECKYYSCLAGLRSRILLGLTLSLRGAGASLRFPSEH